MQKLCGRRKWRRTRTRAIGGHGRASSRRSAKTPGPRAVRSQVRRPPVGRVGLAVTTDDGYPEAGARRLRRAPVFGTTDGFGRGRSRSYARRIEARRRPLDRGPEPPRRLGSAGTRSGIRHDAQDGRVARCRPSTDILAVRPARCSIGLAGAVRPVTPRRKHPTERGGGMASRPPSAGRVVRPRSVPARVPSPGRSLERRAGRILPAGDAARRPMAPAADATGAIRSAGPRRV